MNVLEKKNIKKMIENKTIYDDPRYKRWRSKIFKRDGYGCQYPGCVHRHGKINAHHIHMKWHYPELIFHIKNGITLCEHHHHYVHKHGLENELLELFLSISEENTIKKRIIRKKRIKKPKKDIKKKIKKNVFKGKKKIKKRVLKFRKG